MSHDYVNVIYLPSILIKNNSTTLIHRIWYCSSSVILLLVVTNLDCNSYTLLPLSCNSLRQVLEVVILLGSIGCGGKLDQI